MRDLGTLSPAARKHLDLLRHSADDVALLASLSAMEQLGESATIPALACFVWPEAHARAHHPARSRVVLSRASDTLVSLLRGLDASDVLALDGALRRELGAGDLATFHALRGLADALGHEDARAALFALASCHANGHLREAAVRGLRGESARLVLPFLLARLADWVPEIHRVAVAAVHDRLRPEHAAAFVSALPLLRRLEGRRRAQQTQLDRWIRRYLRGTDARPALVRGLAHPSHAVRREAAIELLATPAESLDVAPQLLDEGDAFVRTLLLRAAASAEGAPLAPLVLPRALGDSAPRVRALALDLTARTDELRALPALEAALLDPAASVREQAQHHLARLAPRDLPAFYRAALDAPTALGRRSLRACLAALAAFRESADEARFTAFLAHDAAAVVAAALSALAAVAPRSARERAFALLAAAEGAVARAASSVLRGVVGASDADALLFAAESARTPVGQRRAVELLRNLPRWQRLPPLLRAATLPAPGARAAALRELAHWLDHEDGRPYAPTDRERSSCNEALEAALPHLHGELPRRLARWLQTTGA
jgi:hypothetical protein